MTTTNYTAITTEQISASLGRETFCGPEGKVRVHCAHRGELSINGDIISMREAFELIAANKVWGMNDWQRKPLERP